MRTSLLALWQLCLTVSWAQFVPFPTDLTTTMGSAGYKVRYKQVPEGICELNSSVKSYSGYVDVADDKHIFFWFFEARTVDPKTAPLTVWLNGGPGASSMIGLFQEVGPCNIASDGSVYDNPYSWSNKSNMLFIDQPAQVGFSYTTPVPGFTADGTVSDYVIQLPNNTCVNGSLITGQNTSAPTSGCGTYSSGQVRNGANSTVSGAPDFWAAMQGFMGAFPQYSKNGFNFATESYGGHYAPIYSAYIQAQNKANITNATQIHINSIVIGNGWYDPSIQYAALYNFTVSPGNTYDFAPFNDSTAEMMLEAVYSTNRCLAQLARCNATGYDEQCMRADSYCMSQVKPYYDVLTGRDEYDIRYISPDPFPYEYYNDYLNTAKVQQAIGAAVNYSFVSNAVTNLFTITGDDARELGIINTTLALLNQNITVTMYAGDADYTCNWLGGQAVAEEVGAPGYDKAGYTNVTTSDKIVHGQVKQSGKFSFVRVYESGHKVPFYQPVLALEMFNRAISNKDIATGQVSLNSSYLSVGTANSTYREGSGTLQTQVTPAGSTYNVTLGAPNSARPLVSGTSRVLGQAIGQGNP